MILAQSIHELISRTSSGRVPRGKDCEQKQTAQEVQHGSVSNCHLRDLRSIRDPIVVEDIETRGNLTPALHGERFTGFWQNVRWHESAILAASQAKERRQDGATNLQG